MSRELFNPLARAVRLVCAAGIALSFGACCPSQPGGPKTITREISPGSWVTMPSAYANEWEAYEDCIAQANLYLYALTGALVNFGHRQETREAAPTLPQAPPQGLPRDPPPP